MIKRFALAVYECIAKRALFEEKFTQSRSISRAVVVAAATMMMMMVVLCGCNFWRSTSHPRTQNSHGATWSKAQQKQSNSWLAPDEKRRPLTADGECGWFFPVGTPADKREFFYRLSFWGTRMCVWSLSVLHMGLRKHLNSECKNGKIAYSAAEQNHQINEQVRFRFLLELWWWISSGEEQKLSHCCSEDFSFLLPVIWHGTKEEPIDESILAFSHIKQKSSSGTISCRASIQGNKHLLWFYRLFLSLLQAVSKNQTISIKKVDLEDISKGFYGMKYTSQ